MLHAKEGIGDMEKAVLITSLPRSGSHYLQKNLIDCGMVAHQVNPSYLTNVAANNIIAKNIFKNDFDLNININASDAYINYLSFVFILRKPEDSIISHITQNHYSRFYYSDRVESLEFEINPQIVEATFIAKNWQNNFNLVKENIDRAVPFTFEQLTKTPKSVIDFIAKEVDHVGKYVFNDLQTKDLEKDHNKDLTTSKYTRDKLYLKTSKSVKFYNQVDEVLRNHPLFKDVNDDYLSLLDVIKEKQATYKIENFN